MDNGLIDIKDLKKSFTSLTGFFSGKSIKVNAVNDVSLSLFKGETLGLVGESGCGKSTVARLILCLEKPDSGSVLFRGRDIFSFKKKELKDFRKKVQIVFQDPLSSLNPRKTCGSIIGEPMHIHKTLTPREARQRVFELMQVVGLQKDHFSRYPHQFSSGQRQRIGLARALSLNPEVIVADEPVSALDVSIQAQTINLLMDLQQKLGLTYLFISHDLGVVKYVSTRVAVMYLGKIVEIAAKESLFNAPAHPYTKALLSSVPCVHPDDKRRRILLKGEILNRSALNTGCIFYNRCYWNKTDVCLEKHPPLEDIGSGHNVACWLSR